jgi:hypothetical protein
MSAVTLRLATPPVSRADVERAWAQYRALQLAEVDDRALLNDVAHQDAKARAHDHHFRLYCEWCRE